MVFTGFARAGLLAISIALSPFRASPAEAEVMPTRSTRTGAPRSAAVCPAHTKSRRARDRALARFPEPARGRVRALAAAHPALADLALTFPALLGTLARPRAGQLPVRQQAIDLVASGAPLRHVARLLQLPLWLRRLPPEAFHDAPPPVPGSDAFACRIVNALPETQRAGAWLAVVSLAYTTCDEHFALWSARNFGELVYRGCQPTAVSLGTATRTLGLLAWYSRAGGTCASSLIARPWTPGMSYEAARQTAHAWLERIEAELTLGDGAIEHTWCEPARVDGIDFVPITTATAITEEAAAMRHCVLGYSSAIADGICRIWSLRRDGQRIATLEIRACGTNKRFATIAQIQGPGNADVDEAVWRAAYTWLVRQPQIACGELVYRDSISHQRWQSLWKPYWRAHGLKDWLPLTPTRQVLSCLARRL